ncbi:MAG: TonB-dependent receptor plug domain-containing protein [Verrucomicrobia bacterium]|nr:TonB-dependent receptor plug domain-containing protein [Verrucomicrobiota bacterium]MDA1069772.1 TonB-dependent receptor plug domain-containing protein [Verrucomicrobiota bacterium]
MNSTKNQWLIGIIAILSLASIPLLGQEDTKLELFILDPFSVVGDAGKGYAATNSISATRINTAIKDVPVPINIITAEFIKDFAYTNVEDAVVADATVTRVGRNEGNFNESFVIRGFRSSLNLRNRIPYRGFTDTSMVERIEIVKGPAAVLYGLSDPGGLVNIITKKPLAVRQQSLEFRAGSDSFLRTEWDTTGPLDEAGKFLYRLTGSYESADAQRAGGWHRQIFVTPSFTILATETTKIDFEYTHQQRNHAFMRPRNPFVGVGFAPDDAWQPVDQDYSTITDRDRTENTGNVWQIDLTQSFGENMYLRLTASETSKFTDMFNLVGCCTDANDFFTGQSNVEILDNDAKNYYADFTITDVEIGKTRHTFLLGAQRDESSGFGQTYRMNGASAALRAALGGYPVTPYNVLTGEGRNPDGTVQMNVTRAEAEALAVQFRAQGVGGAVANTGTPSSSKSTSFFVMDQIRAFDDKLNVLAGLRRDEIESSRQDKVSNTSIQAGFTYEVVPGLNFYSLYSESFVPNGDRVDNRVNPPLVLTFSPSEGEGTDIGFKFELIENTLSGSVAYFSIDRTNILQNNPLPSPPDDEPIAFLSGLENSKGVEAQIFYTPNDNTQFILSYAHTDAKIVESLVAGSPGLNLHQVAPDAVSVTGRHSFDSGFYFGGNWLYRAGPIHQFAIPRREWAIQDGYSRIDAFMGYNMELGGRTHYFRLNVSNVSDGTFFDRTETFAVGRQFFFTWGFDI